VLPQRNFHAQHGDLRIVWVERLHTIGIGKRFGQPAGICQHPGTDKIGLGEIRRAVDHPGDRGNRMGVAAMIHVAPGIGDPVPVQWRAAAIDRRGCRAGRCCNIEQEKQKKSRFYNP